MKKQALYTNTVVQDLIRQYNEIDGAEVYEITGGLVDSYILIAPGYKTAIIKEVYIDCWSSGQSIRFYNKMPAKYEKIIEMLELNDYDTSDEIIKAFYA